MFVLVLKLINVAGEDKVSFQIKSFGLFGPGPRQNQPKPVSPPKQTADQADQMEVTEGHSLFIHILLGLQVPYRSNHIRAINSWHVSIDKSNRLDGTI